MQKAIRQVVSSKKSSLWNIFVLIKSVEIVKIEIGFHKRHLAISKIYN